MQAFFTSFLAETLSFPLWDGLIMAGSFLALGFFILWKDPRPFSWLALAKILVAWTAVRYLDSWLIFHNGLIEGAWPIIWTSFGVLGVGLAQWANKHDSNAS